MGMCNSKNDIIAEIVNENEELRKQVKYLKDVLNDKKKEKPRLKKVGMKLETPISKEAIEKYVEKILENKDMNISYLPDFVEKKIYENVFSITLNLLDDIMENIQINILNHKLVFDIQEQQTLETIQEENERK